MNITAEIIIQCDRKTLLEKTGRPEQQVRWDIRFDTIEYLPRTDRAEPQRFLYTTGLGPGLNISGWGELIPKDDDTGNATLIFGSDDPKSLIKSGRGVRKYSVSGNHIHFATVYDYVARYGLPGFLLDRLLLRPLMIWGTRWSFDRLRIWLERDTSPEVSFRLWMAKVTARIALAAIWMYEGLMPKILFITPEEIGVIARSGLYWPTPEHTLAALGVVEFFFGAWLLLGYAERSTMILSSLGACFLAGAVVLINPAALADPLGGLSKNMALIGCAAAVWMLSPIVPNSRRACGFAAPRRGSHTTETAHAHSTSHHTGKA